DALESFGIPCWIAPRDVSPGGIFDDQIAEAIAKARAVLLLLSEQANQSVWVRREIAFATDIGKLIIPLCLDEVNPAGGLALRIASLHRLYYSAGADTAVRAVLHALG